MILRRGLIVILVLMVAWLQVRTWVGRGSFAEVTRLQVRVHKEQAANEVRSQRDKVLRAEVVDLKNGVAAIEEKARSELGLVKQGETFFLLVNGPPSSEPGVATDNK